MECRRTKDTSSKNPPKQTFKQPDYQLEGRKLPQAKRKAQETRDTQVTQQHSHNQPQSPIKVVEGENKRLEKQKSTEETTKEGGS